MAYSPPIHTSSNPDPQIVLRCPEYPPTETRDQVLPSKWSKMPSSPAAQMCFDEKPKMASMVASYLPGIPGGIFAPSLSIGAGFGNLLHLVFGGELKKLGTTEFRDLEALDIVGIYPNYQSAYAAWQAKAQASVDNAHMRYFVVHLHRLLDPEAKADA